MGMLKAVLNSGKVSSSNCRAVPGKEVSNGCKGKGCDKGKGYNGGGFGGGLGVDGWWGLWRWLGVGG